MNQDLIRVPCKLCEGPTTPRRPTVRKGKVRIPAVTCAYCVVILMNNANGAEK
jgi:hypothetical protein